MLSVGLVQTLRKVADNLKWQLLGLRSHRLRDTT